MRCIILNKCVIECVCLEIIHNSLRAYENTVDVACQI